MYKHIFFDLDNTLWDFETSSTQTLRTLYERYGLGELGIEDFGEFKECYLEHNERLWGLYRENRIAKSDLNVARFYNSLRDFGVNDMILAQKMANEYVGISPYSGLLMPNAIKILEALHGKYCLHVITNGFDEIQRIKMETTGLDKYFETVVTSEMAGFKKPNVSFFKYALETTGAEATDSLVVGDDYEADIVGAINAGIDYVYYNPRGVKHGHEVDCEINDLTEIEDVLRRKY